MTDYRTRVLSNRKVKLDVFTSVFSEPGNAAKLHSALSGVETVSEDFEISTPEFYLFYNGEKPFPAEKMMKLQRNRIVS